MRLGPKSMQNSIKISIEFLMCFWIDFGGMFRGIWGHFGSENGDQKSMKFLMGFWMRKRRWCRFFWVYLAECAGSLGGIIGGCKVAKIAEEAKTKRPGH